MLKIFQLNLLNELFPSSKIKSYALVYRSNLRHSEVLKVQFSQIIVKNEKETSFSVGQVCGEQSRSN